MSEFRDCPTYPEYRTSREGLVERVRRLKSTGEIKVTKLKPSILRFPFNGKFVTQRELMIDAWGIAKPLPDSFCDPIGRIVTIHERCAELRGNNETRSTIW